MFDRIRKLKKHFLIGPDWVRMPAFLQNSSYRSPTALCFIWVYAIFLRIVTVPGRIILPITFLIVSYSLIILQNPIRILAFGLISVVVTDLLLGFIFRPKKVFVNRILPARAIQGIPFEITYEITNCGKMTLWNITVDPIPFFSRTSETELNTIPGIKPGEKIVFKTKRTAFQRGEFKIYRPLIESSFPFAIFKWSTRAGKEDKIIVHPNFSPLISVNIPSSGNYQTEGTTQSAKAGDSTDFIGCREFRTGDNPKHIHWPSTARKGEFIVREFQEEYLARIAIICDRFLPTPEPVKDFFAKITKRNTRKFEALLELNCAIIDYISKSEYLLEIFIAGKEIYHLQGARSKIKYDYLLDVISCLNPDKIEPLSELPETLLDILSSIGTVIFIALEWDESRKKVFNQLAERGIFVKTILLSSEEGAEYKNISIYSEDLILQKQLKSI